MYGLSVDAQWEVQKTENYRSVCRGFIDDGLIFQEVISVADMNV